MRGSHGVAADCSLRWLELPLAMMDPGADRPAARIDGVQRVTFGQPPLEGTGCGGEDGADPPNVSRLNCGGTWPRRSWTATGQCANRRSCQTWAMAHAPGGGGYGRCATLCKSAIATSLAQGSCQRGQQGAPKLGEAAATSAS